MKKLFTLFVLIVIGAAVSFSASAQERQISGKVTSSDDKQTVPGVSVSVKGTTVGTITDIDGNYKLTVPANAKTLVFSFVGMKTNEIELGASNSIDVVMDLDVMKLNEVVVTALALEKEKRSLGYSTQQVTGDELVKSREVNISNALAGKVAGVQVTSSAGTPGASSKILLRGANTFLRDNQPLYVIDGMPMDNSTSATDGKDYPFNSFLERVNYSNRALDINPDDIESINVLKGPQAAVLYGERGANGVIIITTKRAKYGQKAMVEVSTSVQWDEANKLPELQNTYASGSGGVYNPATVNSWGPTISSAGLTAYDNVDEYLRTGMTLNNSIAVSGGTETNAFRLSMSHVSQEGIVPNTDFKRFSARLSAQSQVSSKVDVSGTVNLTNDGGNKAQQGSNLSGTMLSLFRAPASYNLLEGESTGWENPDGSQINYIPAYDNPYWSAYNNTFKDNTTRVLGNVALNYYPINWLRFTLRSGIDTYTDLRKNIYAVGSNNSAQTLGGEIGEATNFHQDLGTDLFGTMNRDITSNIGFNLTLGGNITQRYDESQYSRGRNLAIPKFYNLGNASDLYADQTTTRRRSSALYADIGFNYQKMLFLGISARNEWSSAVGINDRGTIYPGVNLSFVFTELGALKENKVLSFGKLRVAFASAAGDGNPYSSYNTYYKPFFTDGFTNGLSFPYLGQNGYGHGQTIANPNLEHEITSGPEFGVELKFLQDRISLDFTYYDQTTDNIILNRPVSYSTGYWNIAENAGKISNQGIEITLGLIPFKTKTFEWNISANYSSNKNEVLELAPGIEQVEIEVGFGDPAVFGKVGKPYGVLYGTTWLRDGNGNMLIGSDGLPIPSDTLSEVGNPYPDFILGLRNTFTYKNITLSALLEIKEGGEIWNGTQARLNRIGRSEASADREGMYLIEGVKESDGTANDVLVDGRDYWSSFKGDFGATEESVQDASYIRLRELTLSYVFKNIKFLKNLEISFTARNLWLSTDYTGIDPEQSLTGAGSNYSGIDWFGMPNTKSYNFGVRFSL